MQTEAVYTRMHQAVPDITAGFALAPQAITSASDAVLHFRA
jgi:hypothetical protein